MKLARRIRSLAAGFKRTPLQVVEEGIVLQERHTEDTELTDDNEKLAELVPDPHERRIYLRVAKRLGKLWASTMSEDEQKARAAAIGTSRKKNLTAKQRSEIARLGAAARAKKFAERKAKEQQPPE